MPIANRFEKAILKDPFRFDLETVFCESCMLFQLTEQPKAEEMFHHNYPFFTGLSKVMRIHFEEFAYELFKELNENSNAKVFEIGCNDGTFLDSICAAGLTGIGIDPSMNVVEKARQKNLKVLNGFFGLEKVNEILQEFGIFDAVVAANVICHIPDLVDLGKGVEQILCEDGIFIFEEPYVGSMIKKTSYDQIYDEHVYMFSALAVQKIFARCGLKLYDVKLTDTHGGSMRYYLSKKDRKSSDNLNQVLLDEIAMNLNRVESYLDFAKSCEERRNQLSNLLRKLKSQGKEIYGYAATSKSTTVLNYCDIGPDIITAIGDSTPNKWNTYTPGSNIPVISIDELHSKKMDFLVLFAWNHEAEIMEKEQHLTSSGVKWIRFVPKVEII